MDEALARRFVAEASEIMRRAGWIEVGAKANDKTNGKRTASASAPAADCGSIYYRSALKDECAALAGAPKGDRNHALNRASFCLHQLVAGGVLDGAEVQQRLLGAAHANGLMADGPHAVMATIASGARAGMQHPRSRPIGGRT